MRRASRKRLFPGFALLLTGSVLSALAGEAAPASRFSLAASAGINGNASLGALNPLPGTADVPDVKTYLESAGPEWGLSFGYRLSRGFELQVAASGTRSRIIDDVGIGFAGVPLGRFEVTDATLWTLGARLLYGFGGGRISPYLAGGFGFAVLDTREIGSKARPALEFAAGAKVRLSPRLRVDLEIRDAVSFFRYFEDFGIAHIMIYTADQRGVQHRPGARAVLRYYL
jgi:opacity protein-like surface antigen